VAGATQQRRIPPNPLSLAQNAFKRSFEFSAPLESMAEGIADGAEYASASLDWFLGTAALVSLIG